MENKKRKSVKELRNEMTCGGKAEAVIGDIFDAGTFVQLGAFVKRVTTASDSKDCASEFEGVITGYGAVDGRLVFAFVQDSSRMKGAFGEAQAKKICSIYDMAMKAGAPIIGVFDSCGAKVEEGVAAMAAYASVMRKSASASGYIPQIAVISGICAGSAAAFAAMSDFVIAADNAEMYVVSPFLTNDKNSVETAAKNGTVDIACAEGELGAKAKELLMYLPQNTDSEAIIENADDLNRKTPEAAKAVKSGDVKAVVKSIADDGRVLAIASDYAPEMICSLVSVGGFACGVLANDPKINDGAITPCAADKAAGFVNLCTSFGLPVVTLVDSVGVDTKVGEDLASSLASLAYSYAQAAAPVVTVVIGKAYGAAGTVFGSKSVGADVVYALDNAVISSMSPDAAVSFLYSSEISESDDPVKTRKELTEKWNSENASPVSAARLGEVDDIIEISELRQRICTAIEMMNAD